MAARGRARCQGRVLWRICRRSRRRAPEPAVVQTHARELHAVVRDSRPDRHIVQPELNAPTAPSRTSAANRVKRPCAMAWPLRHNATPDMRSPACQTVRCVRRARPSDVARAIGSGACENRGRSGAKTCARVRTTAPRRAVFAAVEGGAQARSMASDITFALPSSRWTRAIPPRSSAQSWPTEVS